MILQFIYMYMRFQIYNIIICLQKKVKSDNNEIKPTLALIKKKHK